jgi:EmrB/QacA subfamily drug resistance transporter
LSATSRQAGDARATRAAAARPAGGAPPRRLGLALAVIATAQLMVVLDATIVNVALPHIQGALHFSGTNLEWVVNAYTLAFGGLLLLGGRSGDLLGRRRVFIAGIALFALASLAGGLATDQAWLLTARAIQGIGAAFAAPTALSLIAVNFPEGPPRNRAMGVYAAMSVAGGTVGLIAGGLLVNYADWRWVLFVNVPIGVLVVLLAPRVLGESPRQRGNFDLPGAVTGSLGVAALVYGLSNAATGQNGVSHWGDAKVVASLAAAAVLLVAFAIIEARSKHALLPVRVLRSRDRSGAYLISLCVGTAMFGMFFFLTIFVQDVWGYSPLRTGIAYLPLMVVVLAMSGAASQLVSRIGARPMFVAGGAIATGGLFWLSRVNEHSSYVGGLLGPMLVTAAGLGLLFVPMSLVSLVRVADSDAGVASSLLNTGQQVGGSIGLAVLGTVTWSAVASNLRSAAATAAKTGHAAGQSPAAHKAAEAAMANHALAYGISHGYVVSAAIALLAVVIAIGLVRVKRDDLAGIRPGQLQVPVPHQARNASMAVAKAAGSSIHGKWPAPGWTITVASLKNGAASLAMAGVTSGSCSPT